MRVRTIPGWQNIAFPELSRRARVVSALVVSVLLLTVGSLRLEARAAQNPEETQATDEAKQAKEDMRAIALAIREFSQRHGSFPKTLDDLSQPLPFDIYGDSNTKYHYEVGHHHYVIGSRGPDGEYGTDDDPVTYFTHDRSYKGPHWGTRAEVYPLPVNDEDGQLEVSDEKFRRPEGTCSLAGRVVSAVDSKPISHATVYLFHRDTYGPIFVRVAEDGSFEFKDIAPGQYGLRTTRTAGYQDTNYNPDGRPGKHPPFTLNPGEHRTDILIELKPAYRLSGRVSGDLPETGEGEFVRILAWAERTEGPEGFEIAEQARVSPDGTFEFKGLDGRPVYIMFAHRGLPQSEGGFRPQYYPGAISRDEAHRIEFGNSVHVENIDFEVRPSGGITLEGHVTDASGRPVRDVFVVVHHADMGFDNVTSYTNEEGRYEISCLGTGDFLVHADGIHHNLVRARNEIHIDGSSDHLTLDFILRPGAQIKGRLVDEQGNPWEIAESVGFSRIKDLSGPGYSWSGPVSRHQVTSVGPVQPRIFLPGEGDYPSSMMVFPTKSTFVLEGVMAGTSVVMFMPQKQGQEVKQILCNGQDITESGLLTKPGDEIDGVTIVIGNET